MILCKSSMFRLTCRTHSVSFSPANMEQHRSCPMEAGVESRWRSVMETTLAGDPESESRLLAVLDDYFCSGVRCLGRMGTAGEPWRFVEPRAWCVLRFLKGP